MRDRKYFINFLFLYFYLSLCHAAFVTDDRGVYFDCSKPAKRVISLAPDLTEILFAISGEDRLVGVIQGSDYPEQAKQIKRVGSYSGIDLERIIQLHPDLILTWSDNFKRELQVLKKFNIPIYTNHPHRIEDVARIMENLGCLLGRKQKASKEAKIFLTRLNQLKTLYHAQQVVSVFYQIGSHALLTINQDSWINQAIELCGGKNVFAEAKTVVLEVGLEALIAKNPQIIISDSQQDHWKKRWQRWPELQAVKAGHLFTLPADWIDRAGPRLIQGVALLCNDLHQARQPKKKS